MTSTKRCVFEADETAILKIAYEQAAEKLAAHYHLDPQDTGRLAKIVFKIGRERGRDDRCLQTIADAESVATEAMVRLLALTVRAASGPSSS